MQSIANAAGWRQTLNRPAEGDTPLLANWEVLPGLTVSYTEKTTIETSFAMAASSLGAEEVEGCVAVFAAHPHVLTFDELIAGCDTADTPPVQGMTLARAGLGAPVEPDERFVERLEAGAFSGDGAVREGALWGMAYAEWPTFRASLRQASQSDPDEFLRRVAISALRSFDRIGVAEQ
ncbi:MULTISPECIES: hypothetical protein [Streptomyces]|uniref:hypothetical protein n=1 Tax=Streptomyces TaxID=1883 RepID=UPI001670B8D1|nr:hypothetical protein [Streptomyces ruber]